MIGFVLGSLFVVSVYGLYVLVRPVLTPDEERE